MMRHLIGLTIDIAIALAVFLVIAAAGAWAFLPAKYLPGNRARHLRARLHLRLHPGKGFATVAALHLRWGRIAALRRSGRLRRSLPLWARALGNIHKLSEGVKDFALAISNATISV